MDPRSGVKDYVRLSVFLERHPDRSGGSFVVWKRLRRLFRGWYPRIASSPLGKDAPKGRMGTGVMKEDDESGKGRGTCGESVSPRETLIKSQSQILQEFLYIASS